MSSKAKLPVNNCFTIRKAFWEYPVFTDSGICFLEFGAVATQGRALLRKRVDFWDGVVHFCVISEA